MLFNTYSFCGSAVVRVRAASPLFAVTRSSSFISYPKIWLNFTCACATMYAVTFARFTVGSNEVMSSEMVVRRTGAPSRYCEKSIRRMTSETSLSFSCEAEVRR